MRDHAKVAIAAATVTLFLALAPSALAAPPSIDAFFSSNVTATSADLNALINPSGENTTYRFEYGPSVNYGNAAPVPDGEIPAAATAQERSVHLTGLNGGTYHFRVIAKNGGGTATTGDQTFTFYPPSCPNEHLRQQTGSSFLPDCRAYELVSPANAGNAILYPHGPFSPTASSPPRLSFGARWGLVPGAGPAQAEVEDHYVATRSQGGWTTRYVGIPSNEQAQSGGTPFEAPGTPEGVVADTTMSRFMTWNPGTGSNGGKYGSFAPYLWDSTGNPLGRLPSNVSEVPGGLSEFTQGGFYGDALPSADFSHYFFSSANVAFAPGGLTTGSGTVYDNDLAKGTVTIASVLPGGNTPIPEELGDATNDDFILLPAASTDGSRLLMEVPKSGVCGLANCPPPPNICQNNGGIFLVCPGSIPSHLYIRVNAQETFDISGSHSVVYVGSTPDLTRIYFTSTDKVTADDTDNSLDLFMWRENPTPEVVRISTGDLGTGNDDSCVVAWATGCGIEYIQGRCKCYPGDPYKIEGTSPAKFDSPIAAATGEIYFVSPEKLDGGKGTAGKRNLYVYRNGRPRYVTTLGDAIINRIQVTPNGNGMAFVTAADITSYDNSSPSGVCSPPNTTIGVPATGPLCREMYTYQPATETFQCLSCMPDGSRPESDVEASLNGPFMANDGRAFFSTEDPLVPQDTNGLIDVYQFVENRPQLISSGTAPSDGTVAQKAGLVGVSADGVDAYFATFDTLVGQDQNGQFLKLYDARTNGGIPFVPPPAPCGAADECHGPSSGPPVDIADGTTEPLGGGGNLKPVKHKKNKKHQKKKKTKKHHRKHKSGARR